MKFEEIEKIEEMKRQIAVEQNGLCAFCGKPLDPVYELAHIIPKYRWILKRYGAKVIHHRLNLKATHQGRCNDGVMISPSSNPVQAGELIERIYKSLEDENEI